jgi:hypothetical protein
MREFTIISNVEREGVQSYMAVVKAVPIIAGSAVAGAEVETEACASIEFAERACERLTRLLSERLSGRGDKVGGTIRDRRKYDSGDAS